MPSWEDNPVLAYRLEFSKSGVALPPMDFSNLSAPVFLEPGTYSLVVTAYMDAARTKPVAYGSPKSNQIVITEGGANTCNVIMVPFGVVEDKQGTFCWNISFENDLFDDLVNAKMNIKSLLDEVVFDGTYYFKGAEYGDTEVDVIDSLEELESGYYQVTFTLRKEYYQDVVWMEILHIYKNMTTHYSNTFLETDFNINKYTVFFEYNYEGSTIGRQTRAHGDKAAAPLTDPNRDGFEFTYWYLESNPDIAYDFNSNITNDVTLVARWQKILSVTVGVPSHTLIPFNNVTDLVYRTTATITVTVSGFESNTDAQNVGLVITPVTGLSFSGHNIVGNATNNTKTFTVTVTYNGTQAFASKSAMINITGLSNIPETHIYNYGTKSATVNIIDGQQDYDIVARPGSFDRRIPVTQANISVFNTYANSGNGRTRHYKLVENVTLVMPTAGQSNWISIGSLYSPFTGSFDGQGCTISNLTIYTDSNNNNQGMFGRTGIGSVVKNLGILNVNISIYSTRVGSVSGFNEGIISNCYSTGNIRIKANWMEWNHIYSHHTVGGIVGFNSYQGIVYNCYTTTKVTGSENIGGVVGRNSGTVSNCMALNENVYHEHDNQYDGSPIVAPSPTLGRIVGITEGSQSNNYAWRGLDIRYGTDLNGLTGFARPVSDSPVSIDGANLLTEQIKSIDSWKTANFDFDNTWIWDDSGKKMPALRGFGIAQDWPLWLIDQGIGTQEDPFKVYDIVTLNRIGRGTGAYSAWNRTAHYILTNNITLPTVAEGESNWTVIGSSASRSFRGSFDGQGYTITNLTLSESNNYLGMFGYIGNGGVVKNLGLKNVNIDGWSFSGGVAGYNEGSISNCYSTGDIIGDLFVGGLVGINEGIISNCYSTCNVMGNRYVGGVVGGWNENTVSNCIALNPSVLTRASNAIDLGRISGSSGGTLNNNYAWSNMKIMYLVDTHGTGGIAKSTGNTHNHIDGMDLSSTQIRLIDAWKMADFDFEGENCIWIWDDTGVKMPTLRGIGSAQDWPAWLN